MKKQVLLIEDDDALRASLAQTLDLEGIDVISTAHYVQARRTLRANFAGVVLTDIRMPEKDGFDILALAQSVDQDLPVVMLTGEADVPMAIRAMREGAYDFLEKPCESSRLIDVLNRAMAHRALVLRTRRMEQKMARSDPAFVNFPGETPASRSLRDGLRRAAETGRHVLLLGAEGVGRRLAAHTIFMLSEGRDRFENLRLPHCDPATLDLPPGAVDLSVKQADQASAAQQEALAAAVSRHPQVRVICSAASPLPDLAETLDLVEIHVPDLSDRQADIPVIFEALLRNAARTRNLEMPELSAGFLADLKSRDWPGHLSQLRDVAGEVLAGTGSVAPVQTLAEQMDRFERSVLETCLRKHKGKAAQVAQELGLPRKTLYDRLSRYGLRPRSYQ